MECSWNEMAPKNVRALIREGKISGPTAGMSAGYAQANLVTLKKELAFDFLLFCQRNQKPCPVLDVTEAGSPVPAIIAPQADIRTDLPKYRIYQHGVLAEEVTDITPYWEDDFVGFLIGCSFSFEQALINNGIGVRHIEEGTNVPMYKTNIDCVPAGPFRGQMVVSMRPVPEWQAVRATQVTSRFPAVHGGPIQIGNPQAIGIHDLNKPDFGDAVTVREGEVPVFWACGVTPQAVAMQVKPEMMITHAPGHMLITDIRDETLGVL
ncbi:putative hydro-lyase [Bacillus atrophaeus]|uniref:putative hydro-lyase n=1 Tax=Bacillus atrophaeus TaxID=1452 RepID=UPI0022827FA0|nr:putative hydro-lyase [Bacillus atrophaeus]MEC0883571.1 putative hydro-lyase [Bacillus atrophaeus]